MPADNYFTYERHDEIVAMLRQRQDLRDHVPRGVRIYAEAMDFWNDVEARLRRGEWADAVTMIEREFEPKWLSLGRSWGFAA